MNLLVPWLLFPLVLGALSLGCGLLLERVAGCSLPKSLLLPAGFAVVVVTALFTTTNDLTAKATAPLVITLAVAGLAVSLPSRMPRVDGWAAATAGATYLAYGAPVILSGKATFTGYVSLDDTATWLNFTDRLLDQGRTLSGLPVSTFQLNLDFYWNEYGYPVGAFPPLGVVHDIVGIDSAWLIQPYHAFAAAMLALGLYGVVTRLIESRRLRALAAFLAAQPALLYGYSLWGGIKEMVTVALFALVAALTGLSLRQEELTVRVLVPLALASAALVGVLNFGGAVWLGPLLLPALVILVRKRGRALVRITAGFVVVLAALSIPSLFTAASFANDVSLNSKGGDAGNLLHPLSSLQLFGIWPVGDFRLRPGNMGIAYALIGVLIGAAVAGIVWAARRRELDLPLFAGAAFAGCIAATVVGSQWIDAKALAIASPAVVLAGVSGAVWLLRSGRSVEGAVAAALIAGGIFWSNALAYHDAWLAPRERLAELGQIGDRFKGQGPTMMTEYQVYGTRHFLRDMAPEAPSEYRSRVVPLRNGGQVPTSGYADLDEFQLDGILDYRTLVVNHDPTASRPPSMYELVREGRYYDVFQRPESGGPRVVEHLPLGSGTQPAAVPRCSDVMRLARLAGSEGRLAAVPRPLSVALGAADIRVPEAWSVSGEPAVFVPFGGGTLDATVRVPTAGRYGIWVGGSFRKGLTVFVDGKRVGARRHQIGLDGSMTPFGEVEVGAGEHTIQLDYSGSKLAPGSGGHPFNLGPIVLGRATPALPVTYVTPAAARTLCGKHLDWVEAVVG